MKMVDNAREMVRKKCWFEKAKFMIGCERQLTGDSEVVASGISVAAAAAAVLYHSF